MIIYSIPDSKFSSNNNNSNKIDYKKVFYLYLNLRLSFYTEFHECYLHIVSYDSDSSSTLLLLI